MNKNLLFLIVASLCVIMLAACLTNGSSKADSRWADYKNWTRLTEDKALTGDTLRYLGKTHRAPDGYREVYVNDIGLKMVKSDGPYNYPVGTVLVKEQYKSKKAWEAKKNPEHTIMIKVTQSSGPEEKNWMWAAGLGGKAKENRFCSGCHYIAAKNDFVFTNKEFFKNQE